MSTSGCRELKVHSVTCEHVTDEPDEWILLDQQMIHVSVRVCFLHNMWNFTLHLYIVTLKRNYEN